MALLTLNDASLAFGHWPLLDHTDFSLEAGERVGLIGRNGTGKSSLLRVLVGDSALDDGQRVVQSGARIALVAQEPELDPEHTAAEAVAAGLPGAALITAYESALAALDTAHDDPAALDRLSHAQAALEAAGAWGAAHRVEAWLGRLGIAAGTKVGSMSGGQRKRVALAQALVAEPDVLMLDEPTNHLDFAAIAWLEQLLVEQPGFPPGFSLVFVTHDRRFLDKVATRIVELDRGKLASFPGNFDAYRRRKADMREAEALANARFDKLLAQEEVWIRKGVEARRTRSVGRVARLVEMRKERADRRNAQGNVKLSIESGERSGKRVAELTGVTKRFGERTIVRNLDLALMRGDKLGILGDNGAGKTTLLRLILGELAPDEGKVKLGTGLRVAYFDQMRAALDLEKSLRDTIAPGSDYVEIGTERKHVMSYLGDFLFAPARANSPVKSLSGGERNRLLLARLFAQPANLLVLDEPTNDLDIETLELLEELLLDYDGTVLIVSHDRAFIDEVVTQCVLAEGDGRWSEYVGGWADVERARGGMVVTADPRADKTLAPGKAEAATKAGAAQGGKGAEAGAGNGGSAGGAAGNATASGGAAGNAARPRVKLSYKEQRELDTLPAGIEAMEAEQTRLQAMLADPATYASRAAEIPALTAELSALGEKLEAAITRWAELEERAGG
ncbi:ATP-binding cassette domain-containing protein [Derxia gummosa]|uniref:ATP-binding protein Uup n=1 Tax=Derxia gummosa DSM 723 TaxID=1121388 RepID=A0A8B6X7J2_9BURK|nr:ATP-binding cassette domain-containing protein [Derxia gummosa]